MKRTACRGFPCGLFFLLGMKELVKFSITTTKKSNFIVENEKLPLWFN